jgi:hypothetical protein
MKTGCFGSGLVLVGLVMVGLFSSRDHVDPTPADAPEEGLQEDRATAKTPTTYPYGDFLIGMCEWTNLDGKTLEATLLETDGLIGLFRRADGTEFKYDVTKLSKDDLEIIEIAEAKVAPILAAHAEVERESRRKKIENAAIRAQVTLKRLAKRSLMDPSSFKELETKSFDRGDHISVEITCRGSNVFGGKVVNRALARATTEGEIIEWGWE